jgi:uncharacterized surface protein with fasciclin (FAS1) repeats
MKRFLILLFTTAFVLQACNDPWQDRFSDELQIDQTIWELLNQDQEFADFVQLIKETGYDTILQRAAVYTVFVPEKSSLEAINSLSIEEKTSIVGFHISNSVVYSTDIKGVTAIQSLSGKQLYMDIVDSELMLNQDTRFLKRDIRSANGVLFEIEKVQALKPNIMEIIESDPSYSYMADFILDGAYRIFDEANSIQIGIDEEGQTIYDSVWISTNDFFERYADLSSEDESFTILLADNISLDTSRNGQLKNGYLTSLQSYVFSGIYSEDEIASGLNALNGRALNISKNDFDYLETASNGQIYKLNELANLPIPVVTTWEFTSVSDFDTIRGVRTVDYTSMIDQLEEIKVSNLDGNINSLAYEKKGGLLNGDQLKILTSGGTDATIEFSIPPIIPGKYKLSINALIRVTDGITYDAYFNGKIISSSNNFNGGFYKNQLREIGYIEIENSDDNVFRIDIIDSSSPVKYCFIDYLLFEPSK